jgi:glycosyltransferase involved in cell wall biosynthesis
MEHPPLVSVVTPSFNAERFIERTIESVLSQDYPRIEYLVMDGGSTDGTIAILDRYREKLRYISAPDDGPASAVNRGFLLSQGAIFAWLNADDTYLPGAVSAAVSHLTDAADAAVVYGEGYWTDESDQILGRYPTMASYDPDAFSRECPLCQPACFMRRDAFASVGMLDPALKFAFDYDLWIRLSRQHRFLGTAQYLATSRMHKGNISLGQRRRIFEENIALLRRHYGYVPVNWVYGYLSFRRNGRDQFFQPLRHSPLTYALSLPVGTCYNRRRIWKYWGEWANRIKPGKMISWAFRSR